MQGGYESRITGYIELLQGAGILFRMAGIILLVLVTGYFFGAKVYRSIDYLSGMKRRRILRRNKRNSIYTGWMVPVCLSMLSAGLLAGLPLEADASSVYSREATSEETETEDPSPRIVRGFRIRPLGKSSRKREVLYTNGAVEASLVFADNNPDRETFEIKMIPLDQIALSSAASSDNADETGSICLPGWRCEKADEDQYEIRVRFYEEGRWKCTFYCEDISGNGLTGVRQGDSEEFIIDTAGPVLRVSYNKAHCIKEVPCSPDHIMTDVKTVQKDIQSPDNEVFFDRTLSEVEICIDEEYFDPDIVEWKIYKESYTEMKKTEIEAGKKDFCPDSGWDRQKGGEYRLRISFLKKGHYRLQVTACDYAGNSMKTGKDPGTQNCIKGGVYTGPLLTLDTEDPKVTLKISDNNDKKEADHYQKAPEIELLIEEESFHPSMLCLTDSLYHADGSLTETLTEEDYDILWQKKEEGERRIFSGRFVPEKEAVHNISVCVRDGCGNKSREEKTEFIYDKTPPEIIYTGLDNGSGDIRFFAGEKEKQKEAGFFPYKDYAYFSKEKMKVRITARDDISGVKEILADYTGHVWELTGEGREEEGSRPFRQRAVIEAKDSSQPAVLSGYVEVSRDEFKGFLRVTAADYCGNRGKEVECLGMISESKELHEKTSEVRLSLPKADYTDEENHIKYYQKSPEIRARYRDDYSGINICRLTAVCGKEPESSMAQDLSSGENGIIYSKTMVWDPEEDWFPKSDKENPIQLSAQIKDNAGNSTVVSNEEYGIVIDGDPPLITVTYDTYKAENKKYYHVEREAVITVKERNFDERKALLSVSGTKKAYTVSPWKKEGEYARCQVHFSGDGEGFKIRLSVEDLAGNSSSWDEDREFVIDRTPPVIKVIMDRSDAENGRYYNKGKDIRFCIIDNNPDPESLSWKIRALCDGKKIDIPMPSGPEEERRGRAWYRIVLTEDGDYELSLSCDDYAKNHADSPLESLTIDTKKPDVNIGGVKPGETYCGEVGPKVSIMDRNLDTEGIRILLVREGAGNVSDQETYHRKENRKKNQVTVEWGDFDHKKLTDGVYDIWLGGEDLAGNRTDKKRCGQFYVNRYGSVYQLDEDTQKLVNRVFVNAEPSVHITEYSVNPVSSELIILKDKEERIRLNPETDYRKKTSAPAPIKGGLQSGTGQELRSESAYPEKESAVTGAARRYAGWYRYDYFIKKEVFASEGLYRIRLESDAYGRFNKKKTATIRTDNEEKDLPAVFVIDRTPPSVQIGNLDQNSYEEDRHEVSFTVVDNQQLDSMVISLRKGSLPARDKKIRVEPEDLDEVGTYHLCLDGGETLWRIDYEARDKAGNRADSRDIGDSRTVLLTGTRDKGKAGETGKIKEETGKGSFAARRRLMIGCFAAAISAVVLGCIIYIAAGKTLCRKES